MPKQAIAITELNKGSKVRVITDLNCSITYTKGTSRRKYIESEGRVYSVKGRNGSKWLFNGNSRRVLLSNVSSTTQEGARQTVIKSGNKSAHSFLDGAMESFNISDIDSKAIIAKLLKEGAKYLSYDPYKVKGFVLIDTPHLPQDCTDLKPFQGARLVYCFEDSVLAVV